MNTSFWTPYISDGTIKAICWTLIHSLWIGMVIALITGLVITLTRKSSAKLRYNLLCSVLMLFVLSVSITYYLEIKSASPVLSFAYSKGIVINQVDTVMVNQPDTMLHSGLVASVVTLLNQNINVIFLVWLLFFMLKSLKMISGLLYIQRIRNYKVHDVAEEFRHKIALFSMQMGIRQTVHLVQSELVKVPVAVGWLKPVILLPMGIILQLSTEQMESILWHELAHICRRDYLVNMLQGLVETVFFFNPGLLWLSSLIRAEREACCDDMVLSRMNRKANYLEALLAFGYEDNSRTALAMSIGSGNQLRDRLKRIVNEENKRLSMAEKAVLAAGLILLSAFTGLPKTNPAVKYLSRLIAKKPVAEAISKPVTVKPIAKVLTISYKPRYFAKDTIVEKTDTAIRFVSVLFKDSDADLANNDIRAMDDKGIRYHFVVVNGRLAAMEINGIKVSEDKLEAYKYMVRYIDQQVATKRQVRAGDIAAWKANSPAVKFKYKDTLEPGKRKYMDDWRKAEMVPPKWYSGQKYADGPGFSARFMKPDAIRKRWQDDSTGFTAQQQRAHNVIADLVKEKIVANAAALKWFGLSETELIVNGQKQPEALQQKFKAKYGIHENYGLYYGPVEMTGTGVFIDNDAGERNRQRQDLEHLRIQKKQTMLLDQRIQFQEELKFKGERDKFREDQNKLRKLKLQQRRYQTHYVLSHNAHPLEPIISSVINDLVSENVIKDRASLSSFKLTNTFLMVNEVKQPDDIQKKLSDKYLAGLPYKINRQMLNDPHFGLHYDVKNGSMGMGISIDKNDP